jgi:hypothetical protein
VLLRASSDQHGAQQGAAGEVERHHDLALDLCQYLDTRMSGEVEDTPRRVDTLPYGEHRLAVLHRQVGSQGLVACHDLRQGSLKALDLERAVDLVDAGDVVDGEVGVELFLEPDALLGGGDGQDLREVGGVFLRRRAAGRRRRRAGRAELA